MIRIIAVIGITGVILLHELQDYALRQRVTQLEDLQTWQIKQLSNLNKNDSGLADAIRDLTEASKSNTNSIMKILDMITGPRSSH